MKHIIPIIILVMILVRCNGHNKNEVTTTTTAMDQSEETHFCPKDSNQLYFPIDLFKDKASFVGVDTFLVKWYSKHLFAMKEPLIFNDSSIKEIYRFTWLRTFHNPIAIRFEKQGDNFKLYWKLCNGAGGYEPGKLVIDKQKSLDKQIWEEFIHRLNKIDFWNLSTKNETLGLDGSQWILEGKNNNHYHVVDRWTPSTNSKYYNCCDFLIGLTDLIITGDDKY
jgi:hypothetical protein